MNVTRNKIKKIRQSKHQSYKKRKRKKNVKRINTSKKKSKNNNLKNKSLKTFRKNKKKLRKRRHVMKGGQGGDDDDEEYSDDEDWEDNNESKQQETRGASTTQTTTEQEERETKAKEEQERLQKQEQEQQKIIKEFESGKFNQMLEDMDTGGGWFGKTDKMVDEKEWIEYMKKNNLIKNKFNTIKLKKTNNDGIQEEIELNNIIIQEIQKSNEKKIPNTQLKKIITENYLQYILNKFSQENKSEFFDLVSKFFDEDGDGNITQDEFEKKSKQFPRLFDKIMLTVLIGVEDSQLQDYWDLENDDSRHSMFFFQIMKKRNVESDSLSFKISDLKKLFTDSKGKIENYIHNNIFKYIEDINKQEIPIKEWISEQSINIQNKWDEYKNKSEINKEIYFKNIFLRLYFYELLMDNKEKTIENVIKNNKYINQILPIINAPQGSEYTVDTFNNLLDTNEEVQQLKKDIHSRKIENLLNVFSDLFIKKLEEKNKSSDEQKEEIVGGAILKKDNFIKYLKKNENNISNIISNEDENKTTLEEKYKNEEEENIINFLITSIMLKSISENQDLSWKNITNNNSDIYLLIIGQIYDIYKNDTSTSEDKNKILEKIKNKFENEYDVDENASPDKNIIYKFVEYNKNIFETQRTLNELNDSLSNLDVILNKPDFYETEEKQLKIMEIYRNIHEKIQKINSYSDSQEEKNILKNVKKYNTNESINIEEMGNKIIEYVSTISNADTITEFDQFYQNIDTHLLLEFDTYQIIIHISYIIITRKIVNLIYDILKNKSKNNDNSKKELKKIMDNYQIKNPITIIENHNKLNEMNKRVKKILSKHIDEISKMIEKDNWEELINNINQKSKLDLTSKHKNILFNKYNIDESIFNNYIMGVNTIKSEHNSEYNEALIPTNKDYLYSIHEIKDDENVSFYSLIHYNFLTKKIKWTDLNINSKDMASHFNKMLLDIHTDFNLEIKKNNIDFISHAEKFREFQEHENGIINDIVNNVIFSYGSNVDIPSSEKNISTKISPKQAKEITLQGIEAQKEQFGDTDDDEEEILLENPTNIGRKEQGMVGGTNEKYTIIIPKYEYVEYIQYFRDSKLLENNMKRPDFDPSIKESKDEEEEEEEEEEETKTDDDFLKDDTFYEKKNLDKRKNELLSNIHKYIFTSYAYENNTLIKNKIEESKKSDDINMIKTNIFNMIGKDFDKEYEIMKQLRKEIQKKEDEENMEKKGIKPYKKKKNKLSFFSRRKHNKDTNIKAKQIKEETKETIDDENTESFPWKKDYNVYISVLNPNTEEQSIHVINRAQEDAMGVITNPSFHILNQSKGKLSISGDPKKIKQSNIIEQKKTIEDDDDSDEEGDNIPPPLPPRDITKAKTKKRQVKNEEDDIEEDVDRSDKKKVVEGEDVNIDDM